MQPPSPTDAPITLDYTDQDPDARYPLANLDVAYHTDRDSNLHHLTWPWHGRPYARSIRLQIQAPIYTRHGISHEPVEAMTALVTRRYPAYVETIAGVEGVIVSKRTFPPLDSPYDKAALWMLACQAEGDRLLQVRVLIDWGEPVEQRIVDGLLVAQVQPQAAQGIYGQQNAESTRVFGSPEGPPDLVSFPASHQAELLYHVLVAGQVDLTFLLTISDVGEALAWNGFLALRDIHSVFRRTLARWQEVTHRGHLWSPLPVLDQAVQEAKIHTVHTLKRLPVGLAPFATPLDALPHLVDACDTFEPTHSRALLDTVRDLARHTQGRLPEQVPRLLPDTPPPDPQPGPIRGYLEALSRHLSRGPRLDWLAEHTPALRLCAEALVQARRTPLGHQPDWRTQAAQALLLAADLGTRLGLSADPARWQSEAHDLAPHLPPRPVSSPPLTQDLLETGATSPPDPTWPARVIWTGSGLRWQEDAFHLAPAWPLEWTWWALVDLPTDQGLLSLLWDGQVLHTTRPVVFSGPVQIHGAIHVRGVDEESAADLHFRTDDGYTFRPPRL